MSQQGNSQVLRLQKLLFGGFPSLGSCRRDGCLVHPRLLLAAHSVAQIELPLREGIRGKSHPLQAKSTESYFRSLD